MTDGHTVRFTITGDCTVETTFACFALKDAPCRQRCAQGCEVIDAHCDGDHEITDSGSCSFVECMHDDLDHGVRGYRGPDTPVHNGIIISVRDGVEWIWHYPEPGELYR